MILPEEHFSITKSLVSKLDFNEIGNWLLKDGYFPEPYVLPPCFKVDKFELQEKPYYKVKDGKFEIKSNELRKISFPKSSYTVRSFGLIEPLIYHDLVWYIVHDWKNIFDLLFNNKKVFSYSFPIPVDVNNENKVGKLRAGRMIYEFLEMAENDLISEAYNYSYLVKTDITNCYPAIYTHSIAWALHGKNEARKDHKYQLTGNIIDKLLQYANDRCTNGIAIGPGITDFISEIVLSAVDNLLTQKINNRFDIVIVRFKDDYRFLCHSEDDAQKVLSCIQLSLSEYNLSLNENKTMIYKLPDGLYRPWSINYYNITLKRLEHVSYKKFENTLLTVVKTDTDYPGTGIIDRFLSDLKNDNNLLKLNLKQFELNKTFSLLMLLRKKK